MTEAAFAAEPSRLLIAAAAGIVLLLLLIIKFKIHPVLSLLISALVIGLGAGMPVPTLVSTVEKGAGETLQGIVLLIGLGSLFGGILEVSGGAQCVAQTEKRDPHRVSAQDFLRALRYGPEGFPGLCGN